MTSKEKEKFIHFHGQGFFSKIFLKDLLVFILCMSVSLHVCMCTADVPIDLGGQNRASDVLEPKLWIMVNHHVGAGS